MRMLLGNCSVTEKNKKLLLCPVTGLAAMKTGERHSF